MSKTHVLKKEAEGRASEVSGKIKIRRRFSVTVLYYDMLKLM